MGRSNFFSTLTSRRGSQSGKTEKEMSCAREAEVLAYWESEGTARDRGEVEAHISSCDDCRELLAILAKSARSPFGTTPSGEQVLHQVERIKDYIGKDATRGAAAVAARPTAGKRSSGFFISFPQLAAAALVVCAVGIGAIFLATRDTNSFESNRTEARKLLSRAMAEHGRRTQGCLSELDYAGYSSVRGAERDEDIRFNLALDTLKPIDDAQASSTDRLALARTRIATGRADEVAKALQSLTELSKAGSLQPSTLAEVLNDTGVAQLHLRNYDSALDSFDRALEASPGLRQAQFNRALALELMGRIDDSKSAWKEFIEKSSTDEQWKSEANSHLESLDRSIQK
jgi:tetratricopeptide (TPR) repeat protein